MATAGRVALVSREVYPFGGGGIGAYVTALAAMLAEEYEVTIFTTADHETRLAELGKADDPRLPTGVDWHFVKVPPPEPRGTWFAWLHLWSARIFEALEDRYGTNGPDLIEFPDYLGEAAVTVQAKQSLDPMLAGTRIAVRLHTSAEMASVLNGHVGMDEETSMVFELERLALRFADVLLWAGGDILGTYERFYGQDNLATARCVRHPLAHPGEAEGCEREPECDDRLDLVYFGRLEQRKGVMTLVRAVTGLRGDDWHLTIIGADTSTGPMGTSMRRVLERSVEGDNRISLKPAILREELVATLNAADATVMPSLWECWPGAALESLLLNRPVLAPRVGGLAEIVEPDDSGWFFECDAEPSLAAMLERLVREPGRVRKMIAAGGPRRRGEELTEIGPIRDAYRELVAGDSGTLPVRVGREPLVTVVIPYFRLDEFVTECVESVLSQTHHRIEVIVVNDGSLRREDAILAELSARFPLVVLTKPNGGLGAARNFGIRQSRGKYVLPLDADNCLEPEFVERCIAVLESDPASAYVTSWSHYIDQHGVLAAGAARGYQPLGNSSRMLERMNVAGDAAALFPRRLFDQGFSYSETLTSFEDWALYRDLRRAGRFGRVIPRRLMRYRVRADSMLREVGLKHLERLEGELTAQEQGQEVGWTFRSG